MQYWEKALALLHAELVLQSFYLTPRCCILFWDPPQELLLTLHSGITPGDFSSDSIWRIKAGDQIWASCMHGKCSSIVLAILPPFFIFWGFSSNALVGRSVAAHGTRQLSWRFRAWTQ